MARKKNPAAVALGRLGGQAKVRKGIAMLSEEERKQLARKGAAKRWGDKAKRSEIARKAGLAGGRGRRKA
jgi:hypothetical protein